jgi:UDP-3-O-[3-hydroxymyristoyl] glucosamine N-acyltransferase
MQPVSLVALARELKVELRGDPDVLIRRIAPLLTATTGDIAFLANPRYLSQLQATAASAVILSAAHAAAAPQGCSVLVAEDPYHCYALLSQGWSRRAIAEATPGIHPRAVVEPGAVIHATATVGALAYIGARAFVGEHALIAPQAHVGSDAFVGTATRLAPQAVLGDQCRIGARGIVHGGVVIGADGFGFAPHQGRYEKIAQLGAVRIGDDVEIGANTCIDRGALEDTVVEDGVKLDNLVQIAHNVHIGAHTAMAGCVGVAGSTRIGAHCTVGGSANILGHLVLVDHVHVSACTVISRSIHKPGQYSGFFPFDDNATWEKNAATLRQLHSLRERLRALEKSMK